MIASGKFTVAVRVVVALAMLSAPLQTTYARSCCDDAGATAQAAVDLSAATAHAEHRSTTVTHCTEGRCQCDKTCKSDCSGGAHGGAIDMSSVVMLPVSPVYDPKIAAAPPDAVLPAETPPPR